MKRNSAKRQAKQLVEQNYQLRQWRQWHRTLAAEALAHPEHGALVRETFEILRTMKSLHDRRILDLVMCADWSAVDEQTKYVVLHEIDRRITTLREQSGLTAFSDALPHQRLNGFLIIRNTMVGTPPGDPGQTVETANGCDEE
jgi:hypothetical protein